MAEQKTLISNTIVALATPPGPGGIGIVRLSGPDVLSIARSLVPAFPQVPAPRHVYFVSVIHPDTNQLLDDGCVIYFQAPHSYTGEAVIEFQLHSSPVMLKEFLAVCLSLGARLAEPGEFTKRAFFNGKMNLIQAESVIERIDALSMKAHDVALGHNTGLLYRYIQTYRSRLMTLFEHLEASLDFPEEVPQMNRSELVSVLTGLHGELQKLVEWGDYGELVRNGVKCLIVGQPNVGKSSLFNQLLGHDRAIVTSIPGTTRDFLTAQLTYNGILFEFIDTAGIRKSQDRIERLGIEKISRLFGQAHLILWMLDSGKSFSPADLAVFARLKRRSNVVVVVNKIDIRQRLDLSGFKRPEAWTVASISAKTGRGIDALKSVIHELAVAKYAGVQPELICNIRQIHSLKSALHSLSHAQAAIQQGLNDECLSVDIKQAIRFLGEVTGDTITEEMLDGIFSRFCIGK